MSRIGMTPITVPSGTKVEIRDDSIVVEGPKGKLEQKPVPGIAFEQEGDTITVLRQGDSGPERSLHGLARSLLANAIEGVSQGFSKQLQVVGVGYRGEVQGRQLSLSLGFSHPVVFPIPEGIEIEMDKSNKITVSGYDKQRVGQVSAEIRSLRPPDPYKGKGVRYVGEQPKLKVGKAGAAGA